MIDYLRGRLVARELDYIVLDVHGIGYRVFCPNPFAAPLKDGEETTFYIHYHVREDAHLLFGFPSREEQSLFRKLLEVTGIGPKVALGVLAGGRPETIVAAIQQENVAFLTKLPGIGRKTAQRIILDLKDKLAGASAGGLEAAAALGAAGLAAADGSGLAGGGTGAWGEAKEALLALGYTEAETDRAWARVQAKADGASADTLVKLALQALYQG
ncbi:ATP-dependent DNA helicase RuvA [Gordoniibacillus kamchatkensis]|uniref:Holliday junction branch migration complex subunit RuvA n=1 Tax=Gordoniibacillus kamchatkensis TaxID=1590651 RepID=A0ABR5AJ17_9BACL|nr:Holliday junction branch migration protein RuvA [Paenibacillus sp. VKM B-2647]KIL41036.1 ATP-dependent DNA helicase RuvA [Paenibacillus sp. VKM B-2647]